MPEKIKIEPARLERPREFAAVLGELDQASHESHASSSDLSDRRGQRRHSATSSLRIAYGRRYSGAASETHL
jgi:hypothetical protein